MRKWIHDRSIVGTVISNQDSSFHMSNRNSAGRPGFPSRPKSGGVALAAVVVDQAKDGYTKRPPSPTPTDEVNCCTPYRPTRADGCAIDSPPFSICGLPDRRKPKTRTCLGG